MVVSLLLADEPGKIVVVTSLIVFWALVEVNPLLLAALVSPSGDKGGVGVVGCVGE